MPATSAAFLALRKESQMPWRECNMMVEGVKFIASLPFASDFPQPVLRELGSKGCVARIAPL
jgi:hypothetical protein